MNSGFVLKMFFFVSSFSNDLIAFPTQFKEILNSFSIVGRSTHRYVPFEK